MFINSNYGSKLLSARHWYIAEKILDFLELFYDSTIVLSGVYYPTSPFILHHVAEPYEITYLRRRLSSTDTKRPESELHRVGSIEHTPRESPNDPHFP